MNDTALLSIFIRVLRIPGRYLVLGNLSPFKNVGCPRMTVISQIYALGDQIQRFAKKYHQNT